MPTVMSGDVSIHFTCTGDGPPLVLIPGLASSSRSFDPVVPVLSTSYRVIAVDNRGTGGSDAPPGPYQIETMADDVARVIESLDIAPVAAVGLSMGGTILQSMLIDHRELLSAAVLLSTFPSYTAVQHAWLDGQLAVRKAASDPRAVAATGIAWVLTSAILGDHERLDAALRLRASDPQPTSYEAYAAHADATRNFDRRAELPTVGTPTLVVVGAEDVLTPVSQSVEIAELIPGSKLVVLSRGGHGVLLEYQTRTLAIITRFLEDVRGPAVGRRQL